MSSSKSTQKFTPSSMHGPAVPKLQFGHNSRLGDSVGEKEGAEVVGDLVGLDVVGDNVGVVVNGDNVGVDVGDVVGSETVGGLDGD